MKRTLLTVLVAFTVLSAMATPAAAAPFGDAFDGEDEDESRLEKAISYGKSAVALASGLSERAQYWASSAGDDQSGAAASDAEAVDEVWSEHNQDLVSWFNARTTASTDTEVVEITFERNSEDERRYLVADANTSSDDYENVRLLNESEFSNTDRTVDETIQMKGFASESASDELENFATEFAQPDEDVTRDYASKMAGKYGRLVETSFDI